MMPHNQMIIRMIASSLSLAPRLNLANQTAKPPPSSLDFSFETEREYQAWNSPGEIG
jgi:hypothetical protein